MRDPEISNDGGIGRLVTNLGEGRVVDLCHVTYSRPVKFTTKPLENLNQMKIDVHILLVCKLLRRHEIVRLYNSDIIIFIA